MILYHGTRLVSAQDIVTNGITLSKGKKSVDFGRGFYTTPSLVFARKCANWKCDYDISQAGIVEITLSDDVYARLNVREFTGPSRAWAQYIINNRNGLQYVTSVGERDYNLFPPKYDISIGLTADDEIFELARRLRRHRRVLSDIEYEEIEKGAYKYIQCAFHTSISIELLKLRLMEKEEWQNE